MATFNLIFLPYELVLVPLLCSHFVLCFFLLFDISFCFYLFVSFFYHSIVAKFITLFIVIVLPDVGQQELF